MYRFRDLRLLRSSHSIFPHLSENVLAVLYIFSHRTRITSFGVSCIEDHQSRGPKLAARDRVQELFNKLSFYRSLPQELMTLPPFDGNDAH
jgi:hypothetical protein